MSLKNYIIKIFILFSHLFMILITFKNVIEDNIIHDNQNFRILVFTCCDKLYSHYIPIFCDTILKADELKRIDIEIHLGNHSLSQNEEKAIDFIRKKYYYSKIKIIFNTFIKNSTGTFYKNNKVLSNSVRFLSQPTIRNKYVYITDIDIFFLEKNFYLYLIDDMIKRKSCYSNIVRKNSTKKRITGLHFILYYKYYPVPKLDNYNINDEHLLYNIMKKKNIIIDYDTEFRPVFGIHASPNRPKVSSGKVIGWGAERYRQKWINYCKSEDFKNIYPLLDIYIKEKINRLNKFYGINITEIFN